MFVFQVFVSVSSYLVSMCLDEHVYPLTCSFLPFFLPSFLPSFIHSFIHSLMHSCTHSLTHSFVHVFMDITILDVWILSSSIGVYIYNYACYGSSFCALFIPAGQGNALP